MAYRRNSRLHDSLSSSEGRRAKPQGKQGGTWRRRRQGIHRRARLGRHHAGEKLAVSVARTDSHQGIKRRFRLRKQVRSAAHLRFGAHIRASGAYHYRRGRNEICLRQGDHACRRCGLRHQARLSEEGTTEGQQGCRCGWRQLSHRSRWRFGIIR